MSPGPRESDIGLWAETLGPFLGAREGLVGAILDWRISVMEDQLDKHPPKGFLLEDRVGGPLGSVWV